MAEEPSVQRAHLRRSELTALRSGDVFNETSQRVLGAFVGFAIGDRLGSVVSGMSWAEIRRKYGEQGIIRYAPPSGPEQLRSSLIRLGLSLDTVIRADRARLEGTDPDLGQAIAQTYQEAESLIPKFVNDVIAESASRYPLDPKVGPSLRHAGGAEELVKYVPLALWTQVPSRLFPLVRQAASTFASGEDVVSIAVFAVMLQVCITAKTPARAVGTVTLELAELGDTEVGAALSRAEQLARKGITPSEIEQLGSGGTAAEAIAIAVCALQSEPYDFDDALRVAVNHTGNSALTGALCGALIGGSYEGMQRIPEHWLRGLTGGHMLHRLAQDACEQFAPEPRDDAEWQQRYPALSGGSSSATPQPDSEDDRLSPATPAIPTLIGVYSMSSGDSVRVAEYRWNPEVGVTVNVLDEEWGSVALYYYKRGVPLIAERREVQASEGPEFMRALLTRKHMGYYGFVDESTQDEPANRQAGDTEGDMSQPQGVQLTALERATARFAAVEQQEKSGDEIGGSSVNSAQQQPAQPAIDPHERFMGSMLAGAVGDALGYAIEFHDIDMIRRNHGDAGLTAPVLRDGIAQISDDTQMMLFTLEGLIRAHIARRIKPVDNDPVPEVQHAYQRWFHTQNQPWAQAGGPYAQHLQQPDGWLITNRELFNPRAPGSTCMSALAKFAQTHQHASPQYKINDSKGCGGVMRAAPVAVWSNDPAEVFYAAVGTAALTHSHPSGYLSAGVLAVIVHQLIRDVSLPDSVRLARDLLVRWRDHEEQLQILDAAVELAKKGLVAPEELKDTLGQGWVGEEALAIGLYAALATDNLRDALLLSVNHSGDSDSTGIVCGNIAGAIYGARAIPQEWLAALESRGIVEALARDALAEFSPQPPNDPAWNQRYPAW